MKPRDVLPSIDLSALEQVDGAFFIGFGPSPLIMSPLLAMMADPELVYGGPSINFVYGRSGGPVRARTNAPRPPGFHGGRPRR
jgi:hypothetical protein